MNFRRIGKNENIEKERREVFYYSIVNPNSSWNANTLNEIWTYNLYLTSRNKKLTEVTLTCTWPYNNLKKISEIQIKNENDWKKIKDIPYLKFLINGQNIKISTLQELLDEEDYEKLRVIINSKIQEEIDNVSKKLIKKYC